MAWPHLHPHIPANDVKQATGPTFPLVDFAGALAPAAVPDKVNGREVSVVLGGEPSQDLRILCRIWHLSRQAEHP